MAKRIVFCADGTWNSPGQDDDDRSSDPTNVYKLFAGLAGSPAADDADEQERMLFEGGRLVQVAKYLHGVGDSSTAVRKVVGGVFGAGILSRIVRGYTFVSRHYRPDDDIVLIGFSRGAYTARALAGLIASQGVLAPARTADREAAYGFGARAWHQYRRQSKPARLLARLVESIAVRPKFLGSDDLGPADFVPVERIRAVAVWDTVGSMGLPRYMNDERVDAYRFADTALSGKVEHGLHALALDEQRIDFAPTFWDAAVNVTQMLFPGAHADVGGGYPEAGHESGLSDVALQWMVDQLALLGVAFDDPGRLALRPDPLGVAHQPWRHPPFRLRESAPRDFDGHGTMLHPSVIARSNGGPVVADPGEEPRPYDPPNLPR